ncbi:DUF3105 domain-containing protein [Rugosimonospora africana]|uniref:DUF3105 domain-containing protein n=1 Tax=Rugosimonospora africana TaxID=556532 RepID=A0A8J3QJQ0_9ACTN|nr:DUF3105 domain-containing protein [Rugosimonospora africana]GIH11836.1 hypothetical protein Raf01_00080 [Rugosimonospora africana]
MSISTPQAGGNRRPSKAVAGGKPTTGAKAKSDASAESDAPAKTDAPTKTTTTAKSGGKSGTTTAGGGSKARTAPGGRPGTRTGGSGGGRPGGGNRSGGGNRPPVVPVKVNSGRHWGPIILFTIVGLVAAGIVGFGVYEVQKNNQGWQDKADSIKGVVDYRKTEPNLLKAAQHAYGKVNYPQSPPVGGVHNPNWERCQGDVYPDQIPNENAVHALEHGSVWVTYNPSLAKDQVDKLASKVRGNDFMLMSPYPGLDKPISLQAWGFQLKLDSADDPRIDQFIQDLRVNASMETGATCGQDSQNYVTKTGTDPTNLGQSAAPTAAS